MNKLIWLNENAVPPLRGLALPPADKIARERPVKTAAVVDGDGDFVQAVGSLWLDVPSGQDAHPCAFVGHFASTSHTASRAVLEALSIEAKANGKHRLVAPIDGSTWRAYRCVVESSGRTPFFLEPQTPDGLEHHFSAAGFGRCDMYASVEIEDFSPFSGANDIRQVGPDSPGLIVRDFNMQDFEPDLVMLHALSLSAFAKNPYYAPLDLPAFSEMYRPASFLFEPGLALIAQRGNEAVGFIFAYLDGADRSVAVLKTIAVAPGERHTGLASYLTRAALARASELRCKSAIFALMHEANKSFTWAARHGHVFRRYALLAKSL